MLPRACDASHAAPLAPAEYRAPNTTARTRAQPRLGRGECSGAYFPNQTSHISRRRNWSESCELVAEPKPRSPRAHLLCNPRTQPLPSPAPQVCASQRLGILNKLTAIRFSGSPDLGVSFRARGVCGVCAANWSGFQNARVPAAQRLSDVHSPDSLGRWKAPDRRSECQRPSDSLRSISSSNTDTSAEPKQCEEFSKARRL